MTLFQKREGAPITYGDNSSSIGTKSSRNTIHEWIECSYTFSFDDRDICTIAPWPYDRWEGATKKYIEDQLKELYGIGDY